MTHKIAFLFPGQGGLPDSLPPASDEIEELFRIAEDHDLPLRDWIREGNTDRLARTDAAQPAILIDSLARAAALQRAGFEPNLVAGHSLGEFAALAVCGVLDPVETLELVLERGRLMAAVSGAMAAVVKLDLETVTRLCAVAGPDVVVANHNGHRQVVVSGTEEAVGRVSEAAEREGGRGIRLNVSGPFHSPFMEPSRGALATWIDKTSFSSPAVPFVSAVTGETEETPERIRDLMRGQMTACVRWVGVIDRLVECHVTEAVEVGAGKVLTGMSTRITDAIEFRTYEEVLDGTL